MAEAEQVPQAMGSQEFLAEHQKLLDQHQRILQTPQIQSGTTQKTTLTSRTSNKTTIDITKPAGGTQRESLQSYSTRYHAAAEADRAANARLAAKYSSLDSLNKHDKIEALKNVNLNPYKLTDKYDGLANSLHRWKSVAADADAKIKSGEWDWKHGSEIKEKIASNYYDSMILPLYAPRDPKDPNDKTIAIGTDPMDKKLWMQQAYGEALNYQIEGAYNNSIVHGLKHGWNEGLPSLARAGEYIFNVARNLISSPVQHTDEEYSHWATRAKILAPTMDAIQGAKSVVNIGSEHIQQHHQFYADSLPNHDWTSKATSFISEQAAQLPIYIALDAAVAPMKGMNLTKNLLSSSIGKKTFGYLMAGTEGLAYGTLTRPQEDKARAWRDAAGFMIFHGMFDIAGMGTKKLGDITDKYKGREEKLKLAQEGQRPANGVETYKAHVSEVANNLSVMGVRGQREIFADALHYVQDIDGRGLTKDQIKDHELKLLNKDPARFGPMLSSAKYVRSLVASIGKPLGAIEAGSEEEKFLSTRIAALIVDAGEHMNSNAGALQEQISEAAEKQVKEPSAKNTVDFYRAKLIDKLAKSDPAVLKMMKPEELDKLAAKDLAKDQLKAAKLAEDKLAANPPKEAENIAKRRKDAAIPLAKEKTKRTTDKFGQPAVSYSFKPDYKVALKNYMKQAKEKGQSLDRFFEDMSNEDFKADLTTHFYPDSLRDSGVFFEHQNSREGKQDPNFLGFMYNYVDQMPKEFGKELENRLIDSMKIQKFMNGRKPTEPQLMYFAKAMYNHVDNFLGSGRWPTEHNIFRSTQDTMWQSTKWQKQLLQEKMIEEKKNLKEMFAGNPRGLKQALTTYQAFANKRLAEYEVGPKDMESQHKIQEHDTDISDLMTASGDRERIPF